MAVFAATDYRIEIAGTNMSSTLSTAELPIEVDNHETTAFGATSKTRIGGLRDASLTLNFRQDFAASTVDPVVWPLLGTVVAFKIRPTSAAISATNPSYEGSVLVSEWNPISGSVGDLAEVSVTWPCSGAISRVTA